MSELTRKDYIRATMTLMFIGLLGYGIGLNQSKKVDVYQNGTYANVCGMEIYGPDLRGKTFEITNTTYNVPNGFGRCDILQSTCTSSFSSNYMNCTWLEKEDSCRCVI